MRLTQDEYRLQMLDIFLHVNRELDEFQKSVIQKAIGRDATLQTRKEALADMHGKCQLLHAAGWEPLSKKGDAINLPDHYGRFPMEPTYFIVTSGGYHWCLANFIKYIVRFPYKNGIEDIGKAHRCLFMYTQYEQNVPTWSLP